MRFVLGALLLLACFALATRWQDRWTQDLRNERDRTLERQERPSDDRAPVVGRVIVGVQSGAPAIESTQPDLSKRGEGAPRQAAPPLAPSAPSALLTPPEPTARVFQLTVQHGQQLGDLCRKHYGTARREVIDALARYNHIADPDQLREGQQLLLPPLDLLLGEAR